MVFKSFYKLFVFKVITETRIFTLLENKKDRNIGESGLKIIRFWNISFFSLKFSKYLTDKNINIFVPKKMKDK